MTFVLGESLCSNKLQVTDTVLCESYRSAACLSYIIERLQSYITVRWAWPSIVRMLCMSVSCSAWKRRGNCSPAQPSVSRNAFCMQLYTSCKLLCPLSGIRRLSAIRVLPLYYIYGDFGWYIWQCPLFSRSPLLVNGESTVYSFPCPCYMCFWYYSIVIIHDCT